MSADSDLEPWVLPVADAFALDLDILGTNRTFGDFLAWANSEVLDSQRRGFVAEFMVMEALGQDLRYISGDMYDLRYRGGIQVKASSAVQLWHSDRIHRIGFSTKPRQAYTTDSEGRGMMLAAQRHGRCWVFAVHLPTSDDPQRARRDVLDATRWHYWVTDPRAIRYEYRAPNTPPFVPSHVPLLYVIANTGAGVAREGLKTAVDGVMDEYRDVPAEGWKRTARLEDWVLEEHMHLVREDAIEAVRVSVDRLRAEPSDLIRVEFGPGVVRIKGRGNRRVAISLQRVEDLAAGRARVLRWRGDQLPRTWDDGLPYAFDVLPDILIGALQ